MTPENFVSDINRCSGPLKSRSPRLSQWIGSAVALGVLLAILIFLLPDCGDKGAPSKGADQGLSIPDEEIQPSLLNAISMRQMKEENLKDKPVAPSKQGQDLSPMPPSGSLAVFVSDATDNGYGALGLPLGAEVEAVIAESINADNSGVPIVATISQDVAHQGKNLLPKGSRLFGQTEGIAGNQLKIRFSRVVLTDGRNFFFSGIALVQGYLDRKATGRGLSVLTGAALGSTGVFAPQGTGFTDTFLRNAQQGGMSEASRDWNHWSMGASPVIKIRANKKIRILVDKAL